MGRCLDSAIRHLFDFLTGDRSEDHLAACRFNCAAIMHYEEMIKLGVLPENLNDLPDYNGHKDIPLQTRTDIPAYEKALKAAAVDYKVHIYKGAAHAFFNDSNPSRYHEEAAKLAWRRTIAFFNEKLKT